MRVRIDASVATLSPLPVQSRVDSAGRIQAERSVLTTDVITADRPIFRDGPEKHLWERTWAAALPRVAASAVLKTEQGEALMAEAERHIATPEVLVAAAKMFAVVGRKPG